ncbi:AMP-binding protein [Bacillus sp. Marseille-P3800]|uniref:AMP-binding protein n=1 Tax=Bacillus sp. Marseille-P3800 TaxID=2014782 RepID=UPI00159BCCCB|nr:AMP-binding protein [Bacillus sp. Marseille-P3800]
MLHVDERTYSEKAFKHYQNKLNEHPIWSKAEKWRIAVCPNDSGKWIMLVSYLKEKDASIVPIHPSTPIEAAKRIAREGGCYYLFYQSMEAPITLNEAEANHEKGLVQFSSGTTGAPKQIVRSWTSIDDELEAYKRAFTSVKVDTIIVACPVTHSYGLISGVLAGMHQGKTVVVVTTQNPNYVLAQTKKYPNHLLYAAPPLLHLLAKVAKHSLNGVMTSGARLPETWLEEIKAASTFVMQQYGCSEIGCISVGTDISHPNEVGFPLSHHRVTAGKKGEPAPISISSTQKTHHTDDLGYFDEGGTLYYVERVSDVINVAGLNVYPYEIERVLLQHHEVKDAVVYKKTDALSGERVCVQVVSTMTDAGPLRAWCTSYMAPHQLPKEFHLVNEIVKGPNGKVNRKQLGASKV